METKTRRAIELPVPKWMVDNLARYLDYWRPILLGCRSSDRLWISACGRPLGTNEVYGVVRAVTSAHLGGALNPHLFRDCLATDIAVNDPEHVRIASAILGHTRLSTTERYYNLARQLEAATLWQQNVLRMRRATRGALGE